MHVLQALADLDAVCSTRPLSPSFRSDAVMPVTCRPSLPPADPLDTLATAQQEEQQRAHNHGLLGALGLNPGQLGNGRVSPLMLGGALGPWGLPALHGFPNGATER